MPVPVAVWMMLLDGKLQQWNAAVLFMRFYWATWKHVSALLHCINLCCSTAAVLKKIPVELGSGKTRVSVAHCCSLPRLVSFLSLIA